MTLWDKALQCCFCGKGSDKVKALVRSKRTGNSICEECVRECERTIAEDEAYGMDEMYELAKRKTGSFDLKDIEPAT